MSAAYGGGDSVTPYWQSELASRLMREVTLPGLAGERLAVCCLVAIHNHDACPRHKWPLATRLAAWRVDAGPQQPPLDGLLA